MKRITWVPILLAVAAIIGVFLGRLSTSGSVFSNDSCESYIVKEPVPTKIQKIINLINYYYVDNVDADTIVEKIIPNLLEQLDPHSVYIPAKDLEHVTSELKSNFGGIGVMFSILNDTVNIVSVIAGGPSSLLGVLPGDKIIMVNGQSFVGSKINNDYVMDQLRGTIGTTVDVTILRGESQIEYTIERGLIPMYSVEVSYKVTPTIGYMKIDRFAEQTYQEMLQGVAKLKAEGCKALIVDLRSNSGGFLNVVTDMCNEFLDDKDLIVYTEGAHQSREDVFANGKGSSKDLKIAVLIDEYSASASEIFAGAMQDNDRGVIIGRRSFGKGLVQSQIPLEDNSAVRLTVARYHTPSGRCIQRPYDDGVENYYDDTYNRFNSGELFDADSVKFDESQIFYTRSGRKVYGGGGIMPDIFVARDTTKASKFLYQLRAKSIIYNYSIDYCNQHRAELSKFDTENLIKYLKQKTLLPELISYASSKGLKAATISKEERQLIENELKAYIGRNIKDNEAFYPIINEGDVAIERAIEALNAQ